MVALAGILCGVGAAAIYASGKSSESEANALSAATRISHLADLAQMVGSRSKDSPLIVAVTGQVGSNAPIKFEHTSVQGVIEMETGNQNYMVKIESGEWVHRSVSTHTKYKEVPWYLEDETSRVHVVGAKDATELVLEIVKRTFEESGGSLARGSFEDFQRAKNFLSVKKMEDFKMLGVTRIVSVLPMGKSLTVVGEAVKDDSGNICIQRSQNAPFYASPRTIDQIIADRRKSARISKFASAGLTLLGVSLMAGEYAS